MKNRKHIQEELHELGVDLSVVEMPDMEIPSHFFESFSALMLEAVKSNDVITSLPIEMPFDIPELYIEQLSDNVRDVIIEEKLMEACLKQCLMKFRHIISLNCRLRLMQQSMLFQGPFLIGYLYRD